LLFSFTHSQLKIDDQEPGLKTFNVMKSSVFTKREEILGLKRFPSSA